MATQLLQTLRFQLAPELEKMMISFYFSPVAHGSIFAKVSIVVLYLQYFYKLFIFL